MNAITFQKMHALGNDFIVIDLRHSSTRIAKNQLILLADRHLGIGCDQILILLPPVAPPAEVYCRIYNHDGSEAEQCGNGLRCIARYLSQEKNAATFYIATLAGVFQLEILDKKLVEMHMGAPKLNKQPLLLHRDQFPQTIALHEVYCGNPHVITELDHTPLADHHLTELGHWISAHPNFNKGVNVGFMHILNEQELQLKTYERGSGWTLSCGSNATASAAYFFEKYPGKDHVTILQQHGTLLARRQKNNEITLIGEAVSVYTGVIKINKDS